MTCTCNHRPEHECEELQYLRREIRKVDDLLVWMVAIGVLGILAVMVLGVWVS